MTVDELIKTISDMQAAGTLKLRVAAFGGMRHGVNITSVGMGFDWDNGYLVLQPEVPLQIYKNVQKK